MHIYIYIYISGPSNLAEWRGWFSGLVVRHLTGNQETRVRFPAEHIFTHFLCCFDFCSHHILLYIVVCDGNKYTTKYTTIYIYIYIYICIYIYVCIWEKKTNKLQVHPYKPVSWSPTHQEIYENKLYHRLYTI